MTGAHARRLASAADLLAMDPDGAYEIFAGEVVEKAAPSGEHSTAQSSALIQLGAAFDRRIGGPHGPGGWWILVEVGIELGRHDLIRPDLAGWRRERVLARPSGFPARERPDWVCEVLSPSTAGRDLGEKRRLLHAHEVGWYWIIDPSSRVLTVLRWTSEGYLVHGTAEAGDRQALPPFAGALLDVGRLFGVEEPED